MTLWKLNFWKLESLQHLAIIYENFHVFQISVLMNSSIYSSYILQMVCFAPNEENPIQMNFSDGRLTSVQVDGHKDKWNCHQVATLWAIFRMDRRQSHRSSGVLCCVIKVIQLPFLSLLLFSTLVPSDIWIILGNLNWK